MRVDDLEDRAELADCAAVTWSFSIEISTLASGEPVIN